MRSIELEELNLLDIGNRIALAGIVLVDPKDNGYVFLLPRKSINNSVIVNMNGDKWKRLIKQMDLQQTEVLAEDPDGIKRAIIRKCERQISGDISWAVFRRDNYTCRYCGRNDVPLSVDHLVLWEDGGPSIEENLVTSCKKCNRLRGNMKYEDWINCKEYLQLAKNLPGQIIHDNIEILKTLNDIPIRLHKISRGGGKKKKQKIYHNTPIRHTKSNRSMKF